jgi:isoprenylcysteine carboxyl methyltransferase (ICMT) family protein YpbQ
VLQPRAAVSHILAANIFIYHPGSHFMPDAPSAPPAPDTPPARQQPAVVIGSVRITGWRLQVIRIVLFGALGAWVALRLSQSAHPIKWAEVVHKWPLIVSIGLWVAFSAYWSHAAKSASAARRSESSWSRALHVTLVNGAMLLIYIPPGLGGRFVPDTLPIHIVGVTIQTVFVLFGVWARRHLGRNWSGEVTVKVDHELVRSGPYRRIRHPIYTAMFGMYAGAALVVGEVHSLVALAIIICAYWRKIGLEETGLSSEFGSAYDDYRRHSWAVVPPVW